MTELHRRDLLRWAGAWPLMMWAPSRALAGPDAKAPRTLILIELKGGNDGLNTVIPYRQERYYALRPTLHIARDQVLALDERVGLHPALAPLMASWRAKDCAIIQGVGYQDPNRSHFRSIEIWETASGSHEQLEQGWLSGQLRGQPSEALVTQAIAVGPQELGPLRGVSQALVLRQPQQLVLASKRMARHGASTRGAPAPPSKNAALSHLLKTQAELMGATRQVELAVLRAPELKHPMPQGALGQQAQLAVQILAAGLPVQIMKLSLGGFDTHANQLGRHQGLLEQLGGCLSAMRANLIELGLWQRTLVMTYSEFGRRAAQNGSRGTDHGTSAPQLMLGGRVEGGLYGQQPSLERLQQQDLVHHVDFRALYATIAASWWGMTPAAVLQGHKPLPLLRP